MGNVFLARKRGKEMIRCSNCGKEISEHAEVCPNCGYGRNSYNKNVSETRKPKLTVKIGKSSMVILGITVAALIFVVFLFLCAQNAYNAVMGRSVLGLGSIFFENCVVNKIIKPIVLTQVFTVVAIVICVAIMLCCVIRCIKRSNINV